MLELLLVGVNDKGKLCETSIFIRSDICTRIRPLASGRVSRTYKNLETVETCPISVNGLLSKLSVVGAIVEVCGGFISNSIPGCYPGDRMLIPRMWGRGESKS